MQTFTLPFVNCYEVLGVAPDVSDETLRRVFHIVAGRYHPDNKDSGNLDRFLKIKSAFELLSDPQRRKEFDQELQRHSKEPMPVFLNRTFADGVEGEHNRRLGVLCLLYSKRRANPDFAALSLLDMENIMAFPRERLLFALWYLRAKRYVVQDDRSSFIISADGVDYLESQLPTNQILHKIFRASEAGVMVFPKQLSSKIT